MPYSVSATCFMWMQIFHETFAVYARNKKYLTMKELQAFAEGIQDDKWARDETSALEYVKGFQFDSKRECADCILTIPEVTSNSGPQESLSGILIEEISNGLIFIVSLFLISVYGISVLQTKFHMGFPAW